MSRRTIVSIVLLAIGLNVTATASPDPAKVQGPLACGECHKQEVETWNATHHFSTFNDMHQSEEAKQIAGKLGIRRIKSESLCLDCHYTQKGEGKNLSVIAGVSCESCHSPARDWLNVHNDYGKDFTKDTEPAEHRAQRQAAAAAAGMLYPRRVDEVARNCFECHIVTDEKLVNVGGHATGSIDFELVAYSQGEVRHNYFASAGKQNATGTPTHLRRLFVVGALLDLEYSVRAVARATEKAAYAIAFAKRAKAVQARLAQIDLLAPTAEVKQALAALDGVSFKLNNGEVLTAAAEKIKVAAQAFASAHDGADLAPLDPLLPAPGAYKGTAFQPAAGTQ